jgi:hypothetical protein
MQVMYLVHEMDDVMMIVLVRPGSKVDGSEWTQVQLLHDISEEEKRCKIEGAIDNAIANPFDLRQRKYRRREEPELHVLDK